MTALTTTTAATTAATARPVNTAQPCATIRMGSGWTIPNRTLVKSGSTPGLLRTQTLQDVLQYLQRLAACQQAEDIHRSLDQLVVAYEGGMMTARLLTPNGVSDERMIFSSNGAAQAAAHVLPGHFSRGLRKLASIDNHGAQCATMAWFKFSRACKKPVKIRTVRVETDRGVVRMIRAITSQTYCTYSHIDYVKSLIANGGEYSQMPVVDWRLTDNGLRLRFAGEKPTLAKPVSMYEAWNNEVGSGTVTLRGGLWKLVCTNGMGSWSENAEFTWQHRGTHDRINAGIKGAFDNLRVSNNGVLNAYEAAGNKHISNILQWMQDELQQMGVSGERIQRAQGGLSHPTTSPGSTLASVVDAVTLIAQDEPDMLEQMALENTASKLLARHVTA